MLLGYVWIALGFFTAEEFFGFGDGFGEFVFGHKAIAAGIALDGIQEVFNQVQEVCLVAMIEEFIGVKLVGFVDVVEEIDSKSC